MVSGWMQLHSLDRTGVVKLVELVDKLGSFAGMVVWPGRSGNRLERIVVSVDTAYSCSETPASGVCSALAQSALDGQGRLGEG